MLQVSLIHTGFVSRVPWNSEQCILWHQAPRQVSHWVNKSEWLQVVEGWASKYLFVHTTLEKQWTAVGYKRRIVASTKSRKMHNLSNNSFFPILYCSLYSLILCVWWKTRKSFVLSYKYPFILGTIVSLCALDGQIFIMYSRDQYRWHNVPHLISKFWDLSHYYSAFDLSLDLGHSQ